MSVFRDRLHADRTHGERFDLAMDRLRSGDGFVCGGVAFRIEAASLVVEVASSWELQLMTEERARADLDTAVAREKWLRGSSRQFADAVRGLPKKFQLIWDYHTGSLLICELDKGAIRWNHGLDQKRRPKTKLEST